MNKTAIKNFAIWARNKLIADVRYRAGLMGITENGISNALPQSTGGTEFYDIGTTEPYAITGYAISQRRKLVEVIGQKAKETNYKTAYKYILEEVAYTWFNRLIAVRFMEVNDYLPSHVRVLSSESGKSEPDIVTEPFNADLEFSSNEEAEIIRYKQNNKLDELFRLLFIKQCNALNKLLPALFEKTSDYTELLLNISYIDQDGVVSHLVKDIDEADFDVNRGGQVEIIGWLYQYYNTEPKNEAFAKSGKITKEEIPAVTQLFTPDWIVRYMVENSLGRLWLEGHPNDQLKANWKYYLNEADQEPEVEVKLAEIRAEHAKLNPEDIKLIDPCMGSGHILVYAFDVFMQIYESAGWTQRDAAKSILENNIYGLDIDDRAGQMAYFAIMMKARQYNRRILGTDTFCHVYSIRESNDINRTHIKLFGDNLSEYEKNNAIYQLINMLDAFKDAKEYGSILKIDNYDWSLLKKFINEVNTDGQMSFETIGIEETAKNILRIIEIAQCLSSNYDIAITNPPYMNPNNASKVLEKFVKTFYEDSKTDMFAVFMEKCRDFLRVNGFFSMITQHSWMFLSSYEKLRRKHVDLACVNMMHLGAHAFEEINGEVVQSTSFVYRNIKLKKHKGMYLRLIDEKTSELKEKEFFNKNNRKCSSNDCFEKIPGAPIAYWVNENIYRAYNNNNLDMIAQPRHGLATSDNMRFLRVWTEVDVNRESILKRCDFSKKWFPINKGGTFRKWYGNLDWVINYENDGKEIKDFAIAIYKCSSRTIQNTQFYFRKSLTWSALASSNFSVRWSDEGAIFGSGGYSAFVDEQLERYILALMNNKVNSIFIEIVSPTLNYEVGHIKTIPVIIDKIDEVNELVDDCINQSRADWDSFETSWDFKKHPLI